MLPAQRNKIDLSKLSDQEKVLISKYGKLPTHKNILTKMQKERKYFDSGDYALSKAGVAPQSNVGTAIPNPENIPHASQSAAGTHALVNSPTNPTSPMNKESNLSQSQTTDVEMETETEPEKASEAMAMVETLSAPAATVETTTTIEVVSAPVVAPVSVSPPAPAPAHEPAPAPPAPVEEKVVAIEVEQVVVEPAQAPVTITTVETSSTAMETTPDK